MSDHLTGNLSIFVDAIEIDGHNGIVDNVEGGIGSVVEVTGGIIIAFNRQPNSNKVQFTLRVNQTSRAYWAEGGLRDIARTKRPVPVTVVATSHLDAYEAGDPIGFSTGECIVNTQTGPQWGAEAEAQDIILSFEGKDPRLIRKEA